MSRRMLVAAIIGLALALASPAQAAPLGQYDRPEAALWVETTRWNPGSQTVIKGANFSPNEAVTINYAGASITAEATPAGTFAIDTTIPWVSPGNYTFSAQGQQSQRWAEFAYHLQAFNPWGQPSAYWFPVGTDLNFSGHRFANTEQVDVLLDGNVVSTATTNFEGEFYNQGSYVVPRSKFGQALAFTMIGRTSGAVATFNTSVANWPLLEEAAEGPDRPGDGEDDGDGDGRPDEPATEPTLTTETLSASLPGQSLWHTLSFTGGNYDVCDLRVTATASGATITYPFGSNFSSPHNHGGLDAGVSDFVAVNIVAPSGVSENQSVNVEAIYRGCGDVSVDRTITKTVTLPISVEPPVRQITTDLGTLDSGVATWVDLYWEGQDGNLTDFQVEVTNARGAAVRYPAFRTFTSLQNDDTLEFGEMDYVAVNIDTTGLAPGVYVLGLEVTTGPYVLTPTVSFTVAS